MPMMPFFKIVSSLVIAALLASPVAATTSAATTASSTNSSSSGVGTALTIGAAVLGIGSLLSSITTLSFGGKVIGLVPCSAGMIWVLIIPAGTFPTTYIWTPATQTKLAGPPNHPGQEIKGVASRLPGVCFIGGGFLSSPIPLYGNYMLTVGTSEI